MKRVFFHYYKPIIIHSIFLMYSLIINSDNYSLIINSDNYSLIINRGLETDFHHPRLGFLFLFLNLFSVLGAPYILILNIYIENLYLCYTYN